MMAFRYQARIMLSCLFRHTRRRLAASVLVSVAVLCLGVCVLYRYSGSTLVAGLAVLRRDSLTLADIGTAHEPLHDSRLVSHSSPRSVFVSSRNKSGVNSVPGSLHSVHRNTVSSETKLPVAATLYQHAHLNASSQSETTASGSPNRESRLVSRRDGLAFRNSSHERLSGASKTYNVSRSTESSRNKTSSLPATQTSLNRTHFSQNKPLSASEAHSVVKPTNSSRANVLASPASTVRSSRKSASDEVELDCSGFQFSSNDSHLHAFKPATTREESCLLLETLQALDRALRAADIPYFLYGGSLLGSWRHHGLVPWDDDVDVSVDVTRLEDLRHALGTLAPRGFSFKERTSVSWKLYSDRGQKIHAYSWRWPFVDVCFFQQNDTHVWERETKMFPEYVFPKAGSSHKTSAIWWAAAAAPRQTKKVLELTYNLTLCAIGRHSHRRERPKADSEMASVHCDVLKTVYPFVRHVPLGHTACNESVLVNGAVVSWMVVESSPQCS